MAPSREIDSFECTICGVTLETWDTAWVPSYRLISAPEEGPRRADDAKTHSTAAILAGSSVLTRITRLNRRRSDRTTDRR